MIEGSAWHTFLSTYYKTGQLINEQYANSVEFRQVKEFVSNFRRKGFSRIEVEVGVVGGRIDMLLLKGKEAILIDWKYSQQDINKIKQIYTDKMREYLREKSIIKAYLFNIRTGEYCEIERQKTGDCSAFSISDILEFDPEFLLNQPFRTGPSAKMKGYRGQTVAYAYQEMMRICPEYYNYICQNIDTARNLKDQYPYSKDLLIGCRQIYEYNQRFQEEEKRNRVGPSDLVDQLRHENQVMKEQLKIFQKLLQEVLELQEAHNNQLTNSDIAGFYQKMEQFDKNMDEALKNTKEQQIKQDSPEKKELHVSLSQKEILMLDDINEPNSPEQTIKKENKQLEITKPEEQEKDQ